jgi:hypothetical protein
MVKKTWEDKINNGKEPQIKTIEKAFWGMDAGSRMLIPTPKMIQDYIYHCEKGNFSEVQTMRNDLAIEAGADFTCPMTSGIFLRIVCEYHYEKWQLNAEAKDICPFWRMVDPKSDLAKKLSFGSEFIAEMRQNETLEK